MPFEHEARHERARAHSSKPALDDAGDGRECHAEELETLAKEVVVHPVRAGRAERVRTGGNGVHRPHDEDEERQTQDTVRDHAVDLLRDAHARGGLLHALVHDVRNHRVALARDDGFGIVVAILLALGDERLDAGGTVLGEVNGARGVLVAFEELHRKVAALVCRHRTGKLGFDLVEDILDRRVELVLWHGILRSGGSLSLGDELVDAGVPQRGDHDDRCTQAARKRLSVDLVAVLLHEVGHVERHDHGQARLDDLQREVEVALEVRGVEELDHHVGLAAHEIVAAHALLGAIGGKRIDTGKVGHSHAFVARELGLLLLDRHARPVAYVAVLTGNEVEECRLAAVGVARQRDMKL